MMRDVVSQQERPVFEKFLHAAIDEARKGLSEGGIPIGSALGNLEGEILAVGHNMRVQLGDPMAHAEISCLRNAGRLPSFRGLILASSLMPCCLCSGAAIQFGIGTVVVGESKTFPGERALMESRNIRVVDFDHPDCIQFMTEFIRRRPDLWNEDIGVEKKD